MADALIAWLRQSLPEEVAGLAEPYITHLERGEYQILLESDEATTILSSDEQPVVQHLLSKDGIKIFCTGYAALLAFVQANVTGPPLSFSSSSAFGIESGRRERILANLGSDGIAAYKLTPSIELLWLADRVFSSCSSAVRGPTRWAHMRTLFMRQRLLSEVSGSLQDAIYDDLDVLAEEVRGGEAEVEFLLERAAIHIHHGLDKLAREDLESARAKRAFTYAVTGLMGKRTKFQQKDTSQLVVLAKSAHGTAPYGEVAEVLSSGPAKLDLNDDTLLESISFAEKPGIVDAAYTEAPLPAELQALDPSNQPQLDPLDSTILLLYAASITNTSPSDGLTREETLPYAIRVLDGGSSNWQVYTQALLSRSRIEGYHSRTIERGLLQLQALVDQVIADTSNAEPLAQQNGTEATSFLPRSKESESAPATERLRYVFQLAPPTRWDLEAELASRWVSLGGLRSALEIYERLELWAEAALCWAATEREDKAKKIVRRQLFHATSGGRNVPEHEVDDDEAWEGPERDPPPLDAPRLYCILGDLDQSIEMYEKAWEVSKQRYARAQRSLGRLYISRGDFVKAAEAFAKSLKVNQLNSSSWFALGCALLELAQFEKAAEAFSRCVQLDDGDAEAWSNFAAALLRIEPAEENDTTATATTVADDEDADVEIADEPKIDPQKNRQDALKALKRAASLKHDSYRIWENVLIVASSLSPPDLPSALSAQKRIIDLRGPKDGEKCVDKHALFLLTNHVIAANETFDPAQPGLARLFVRFVDADVVPLITGSAELWRLVGRLALWRNKPSAALEAEEKAWRVVSGQPEGTWKWDDLVEATIRLCDSYESLGPRERTEGMAAGTGEVVAKDWKFKARSAVKGVLGKGKGDWEDSEGWERLKEVLEGLKG